MSFPDPRSLFNGSAANEPHCTQCLQEFDFTTFKYHCRKCGLVFCNGCTNNRSIIPQDQLAPVNHWFPTEIISSTEDEFRKPQRVCSSCYFSLLEQQTDLRQTVSRFVLRNIVLKVDELESHLIFSIFVIL
jgi:hypothetical protein